MKTSPMLRHMQAEKVRRDGRAPVPPVAKHRGDIVQSDALDLLHSIEPESVSCIVADPPYGIAYHSNRHQEKNPHAPIAQDWNVEIGAYLVAAERALAPGGAVYLFTRWDVYPLWAAEVPAGMDIKNLIVWDKGNHSSGDLTGNFGFQHEFIMFLVKGRHTLQGHRWSNVWSAPKIPHKKLRMAAEKPVELYERAILSSSQPGALVIDTFGGSGTMAEAAMKHGRRFLVGDADKKMVRMARLRVGLEVESDPSETAAPRACPIFKVNVPSPSLWGLHPEDVSDWLSKAV